MTDTTYVLGAGAMGLLFAAKLSRTRVGLLVKPEKADVFNLGLNYRASPSAISKKMFLKVLSRPSPNLKIHRLILATKAGQAATALSFWQEALAEDAQILMLQNGMGSQAEVAQLLKPSQSLLVASLTQAAYLEEPNLVVEAGQGLSQLGLWQGETGHLTNQWQSRLTSAGINIEVVDNIRLAVWHKLAINAVINPLTASHHIKNGELKNKQYQPLVRQLVEEISQLFSRLGLAEPQGGLANKIDEVILATAQNYSSMHQDVHQGRCTEIDYITASLLKAAKAARVEMPQHQQLYNHIKSLEK